MPEDGARWKSKRCFWTCDERQAKLAKSQGMKIS